MNYLPLDTVIRQNDLRKCVNAYEVKWPKVSKSWVLLPVKYVHFSHELERDIDAEKIVAGGPVDEDKFGDPDELKWNPTCVQSFCKDWAREYSLTL